MNKDELLKRITSDPKILGGRPIIRGYSLAVADVLSMLAAGDSIETILERYPGLECEDVHACLVFAMRIAESHDS
ncbi:MAG: DUF433 domain-containing protein [Phycisphaerae bacterium]|nr:DUF433 domain-containing protein [Phycisphaerae bacterium]